MTSRLLYLIIVIVVLALGWFVFAGYHYFQQSNFNYSLTTDGQFVATNIRPTSTKSSNQNNQPATTTSNQLTGDVIGGSLPEITVLAKVSDTKVLIGSLTGQIYLIELGKKSLVVDDLALRRIGSSGLVGLSLDKDFLKNSVYYAEYVYRDDAGEVKTAIDKRQADITGAVAGNKSLGVVADGLVGGLSNNGAGLLAFKNNFFLFFGDLGKAVAASDRSFLNGKVLKLNSLTEPINNDKISSLGLRNPKAITTLGNNIYFIDATLPNLSRVLKYEDGTNYGWPISPNCSNQSIFCAPNELTAITSYSNNSKERLIWADNEGRITIFDLASGKVVGEFTTPYHRIGQLTILGDLLIITTDNRGKALATSLDNQIVGIDLTKLNL